MNIIVSINGELTTFKNSFLFPQLIACNAQFLFNTFSLFKISKVKVSKNLTYIVRSVLRISLTRAFLIGTLPFLPFDVVKAYFAGLVAGSIIKNKPGCGVLK